MMPLVPRRSLNRATFPAGAGAGTGASTGARGIASPCALVVTVLVAAAIAPLPAAGQSKPAAPEHAKPYGRTPPVAVPYREFREPYARFFDRVVPFRGVRHDDAASTGSGAARIGFFGPDGTAPDADLGRRMWEGVSLAFEQANADREAPGPRFELVRRRDSGLWGASSNEMIAFAYDDVVLAVIGSIDGANTHIALRVALKTQVPMVNTATTDPTLTETNIPWIVRCMADDRQQGYALAHHIFVTRGLKQVVAFRANDRFGRTGIAEFRDAARRRGRPLRAELRWDRGERDFSRQLARIAEIAPEGLVLWGDAADTAAVVRAVRRTPRLKSLAVFGCDRMASRAFLEEAGAAADGVVAVATYDPTRDDARYRKFVSSFVERFGHKPEAFAAHAYDGANILIAAVRRGGLDRVRIRDALYEYKQFDGVTGHIEFDATLNDVGPVYIAQVQDGRFVYRAAPRAPAARADAAAPPYETIAAAAARLQARWRQQQVRHHPPAAQTKAATLRVGCFVPLDAAGQAVVRGARLALADEANRHPQEAPIELLVGDARGAWGRKTDHLVELVADNHVTALIGSIERDGTHLAETLAARLHLPVVTLCDTDRTVTAIPLPWVFCVAPATDSDSRFRRRYAEHYGISADSFAALGYDAASLLTAGLRHSGADRRALRTALAAERWHHGVTGTFRFDAAGNRINVRCEDSSVAAGNTPASWLSGGSILSAAALAATIDKGLIAGPAAAILERLVNATNRLMKLTRRRGKGDSRRGGAQRDGGAGSGMSRTQQCRRLLPSERFCTDQGVDRPRTVRLPGSRVAVVAVAGGGE